MNIDYLISKMNIKGISLLVGVGGEPELVTNDVYGAMGLSGLSSDAYIVGSAYVNRDSHMVNLAVDVCTFAVGRLCVDLNWSLTRPYHSRVGCAEKVVMGKVLKGKLAVMAILELLSMEVCQGCQKGWEQGKGCNACVETGTVRCGGCQHGRLEGKWHKPCRGTGKAQCERCEGSGQLKGRRHRACGGTGNAQLKITDRAEFCDIKYTTWRMTWEVRYGTIRAMLTGWVNEFTTHLEEKCQ